MKNKFKKGKFIVIEGIDGSGKATQTNLLFKRLKSEGCKVKKIDFPRYRDNFFGKFIGECLAGEHGDFLKLSPRIASVLYAADRFESGETIKSWINRGYFVVADRYTSANQIHQGGKISNKKERQKFIKWLDKMEFDIFKISKPQLVLYLDVPVKVSQKLLNGSERVAKARRNRLKGGKDLHESNVNHLTKTRRSAAKMIEGSGNWLKIDCAKKGEILSRKEISIMVWETVRNKFKI